MLDLRITYEQFCEIWSSIFLPEILVPESLLAGIAERYRLLVLSNTNAIHFDMVRGIIRCSGTSTTWCSPTK